jgi:Zn-dependent peptidase ImmA (M78 family)
MRRSIHDVYPLSKNNPVLGFAIYDPVCPVIVVKKQDFESRQTFTLIHELGHLLLHRQSSIDDQNDFESTQEGEREANEFAGYFLVPDVVLATINDELRPSQVSEFDNWLASFRRDWGVSSEVILRRLLGASRLSSELYTEYRAWASAYVPKAEDGGSRLYRHREPIHIFGHRYVRTVLDSLEANNITLARACTYLDGIKIKKLRQLEGHYAGVRCCALPSVSVNCVNFLEFMKRSGAMFA